MISLKLQSWAIVSKKITKYKCFTISCVTSTNLTKMLNREITIGIFASDDHK